MCDGYDVLDKHRKCFLRVGIKKSCLDKENTGNFSSNHNYPYHSPSGLFFHLRWSILEVKYFEDGIFNYCYYYLVCPLCNHIFSVMPRINPLTLGSSSRAAVAEIWQWSCLTINTGTKSIHVCVVTESFIKWLRQWVFCYSIINFYWLFYCSRTWHTPIDIKMETKVCSVWPWK